MINLHRHRVQLHAQARGRFIHQIHRLIWQETVGDVAVGQLRGTHQGAVLNANAVVHLVALLQPAQNRDGLFDRRFRHGHRLKPPFQCRVFLDVFAILIQRRRANTAQFAARQLRLQHVRRIRRTFRIARAHNRVQLVDKQNDLSLGRCNFLEERIVPANHRIDLPFPRQGREVLAVFLQCLEFIFRIRIRYPLRSAHLVHLLQ